MGGNGLYREREGQLRNDVGFGVQKRERTGWLGKTRTVDE